MWVQTFDEHAQEVRLTTGDHRYGRTAEELAEIDRCDAEWMSAVRDAAGVCDEFPGGEFAVPGFNCHYDYEA